MIREVAGQDTAAIVALWNKALVRDPITEQRFANWLFADPDFDVNTGNGAWVAERDGRIIGFARAIKRSFPNDRAGVEESTGWVPAIFVDPEHTRQAVGNALLDQAIGHLHNRGAKQLWVCGNTGSAPGYLFPGVDKDAYAAGLAFFLKHGFVIDHEPIAMSRPLLDFDTDALVAPAGITIQTLSPERTMPHLAFLRDSFPGDWNTAARNKLRAGGMSQVLVAINNDRVVGYCQWESDGHFGPFGVDASMRGKGLGRSLFIEACRQMKQADVRHVWFNWADADAERFYRRQGLEQTRRFAILRKDLPA